MKVLNIFCKYFTSDVKYLQGASVGVLEPDGIL